MNRYRIAAALVFFVLLVVAVATRTPKGLPPVPDFRGVHIDEGTNSASSSPADEMAEELADTSTGEAQTPVSSSDFSCPDPDYAEVLDMAAMAAALEGSGDPEHLLMATLYGGKQRRPEPSPYPEVPNLDSLLKGLQTDPRNELLLWNALTLCTESDEQARCDEHDIPKLATAVLGDNASFWLRLAGIRADADDTEGAFDALERALDAPEHKEYFIEHVELFARGISAFNNAPFNERVITAMGLAAALPNPEIEFFQACQQQASTAARWLYICIEIGERMEARARTLMTELLGLGLQQRMYEIAGDDQRARSAEIRGEARRKIFGREPIQTNELAVLTHDARVLESYIDVWKVGGERQAMMFLQYETRRLMNVPGYDPCGQ